MNAIYANESFSKKMLAGGIIGPILSFAIAILMSNGSRGGDKFGIMMVLGFCLAGFFAITVVVATYYWRVTVKMIVHGISRCFSAIFNYVGGFAFFPVGWVVFLLAFAVDLVATIACLVIAIGPYVAIPVGGLYLLSLLEVSASHTATIALYIAAGVLNVAWIAILHILLPLRNR